MDFLYSPYFGKHGLIYSIFGLKWNSILAKKKGNDIRWGKYFSLSTWAYLKHDPGRKTKWQLYVKFGNEEMTLSNLSLNY